MRAGALLSALLAALAGLLGLAPAQTSPPPAATSS